MRRKADPEKLANIKQQGEEGEKREGLRTKCSHFKERG